jgi:hypothetical protein
MHTYTYIQASEHNGIASDSRIFFSDLMQNADPNCNIPGAPCARVSEMSVPLDVESKLFPEPYDAGVRVHLNAWGCRVGLLYVHVSLCVCKY